MEFLHKTLKFWCSPLFCATFIEDLKLKINRPAQESKLYIGIY